MMGTISTIICILCILSSGKCILSQAIDENIFGEETNITCVPSKNWKVLSHNDNIIKNVCISNNYDAQKEPNEHQLTHIEIRFPNIKVVNVDEQKKRLIIDITALALWEDGRIWTFNSKDDKSIRLPSMLKGESSSVVWNPFRSLRISKLKKIRYNLDPTIMDMALVPKKLARNIFQADGISNNTFLVASRIEWSVLLSCPFDFSHFPFDTNICPLEIKFHNLNVTLHDNVIGTLKPKERKETSEGFEITIAPTLTRLDFDGFLGNDVMLIPFNITMKRQVTKYLYQYYIPCMSIVTASSFSFIIPISAIPGRVALVVTQFLTLTNIFINQMVFLSFFFIVLQLTIIPPLVTKIGYFWCIAFLNLELNFHPKYSKPFN